MLIANRLRSAGVIFLVLGAHLIIPKISEVTSNFHQIVSHRDRAIAVESVVKDLNKSTRDKDSSDANEFRPPNNGGFDSDYGSGTR
ncbi:MAG: hypothetical protein AAF208_12615 [Cyanobacteria bacterium P01_A01_bin.45]